MHAGDPSVPTCQHETAVVRPPQSGGPGVDSDTFLAMTCQTVIHALQANAAAIPVYCDVFVPSVLNDSNIRDPPHTLRPTTLQSQIHNLAFVAALPLVGLRDSILRAFPHIRLRQPLARCCEWRLLHMRKSPWMPQRWEVTEHFASKWWFLIHRVLRSYIAKHSKSADVDKPYE